MDEEEKGNEHIETINEVERDSESISKELIGETFNKLAKESKTGFKFRRIDTKVIDNDEGFQFGKNFKKIDESDNARKNSKKRNKRNSGSRQHRNSSFKE